MSGYHPQLDLGSIMSSCAIESLDDPNKVFEFDDFHEVRLTLITSPPDEYVKGLTVGEHVEFFEGSNMVGEGIILAIIAEP